MRKYAGWRLNYYKEQRDKYVDSPKVTAREAEHIWKKLRAKYRLKQDLYFHGYRDSGSCGDKKIRLSNNPSIYVIAHEVAHAIQRRNNLRKLGTTTKKWLRFHNKTHDRWTEKIYNHVMKNLDTWIEETKARKLRTNKTCPYCGFGRTHKINRFSRICNKCERTFLVAKVKVKRRKPKIRVEWQVVSNYGSDVLTVDTKKTAVCFIHKLGVTEVRRVTWRDGERTEKVLWSKGGD